MCSESFPTDGLIGYQHAIDIDDGQINGIFSENIKISNLAHTKETTSVK